MMTLFSIPRSLLKVNPIEIKYRSALKDEQLKHATFASSFYAIFRQKCVNKCLRPVRVRIRAVYMSALVQQGLLLILRMAIFI